VLQRLALAVGVLVLLIATGTLAFVAFGDDGIEEAIYRTFGALTTASFVSGPDTSTQRAISAVLTLAGGIYFLGLVGALVQSLLRRAFAELYRERRMIREIEKLRGHYVVCGYGRVGRAVVKALLDDGNAVVVVETKEENWLALERNDRFLKKLFLIKGSADDQDVLNDANVSQASGLVACVGSDAMNVYIALAARRCYKDVPIVSRASDEMAEKNLGEAREILNEAITPYTSAGRDLAEAVKRHARNAKASA
jgi:voltage-gated potassium channel